MIMILTGKAKDDFSYKYNMSNFNEYSEVLQYALIIEWFDSVGIYIEIIKDSGFGFITFGVRIKKIKLIYHL